MHSLYQLVLLSILLYTVTAKYAYVTIHYEGTKRDDEYALAVRVWAKSLFSHGIKQDVIVLISDNVRESTRKAFKEVGCQLRVIQNIENPYKSNADRRRTYKTHFEYTLNKLHVWNMLDYERVIYMDADNLFFANIDELFQCGHFCAVYMNPCNFHTGLLVITPNNNTYNDLLKSLATLPSYDGADQGFLVAYFQGLQKAPLFNAKNPIPANQLPKMQRLEIGYNNNHIFHYVEGAMDQFRVFGLKNSEEPFYSLTYAITPILKPWYWWGYPILDMHWYWNQQRSLLKDNWTLSFLLRLACMLGAVVLNNYLVKYLLYRNRTQVYTCSIIKRIGDKWYLWYLLSSCIGIIPAIISLKTVTWFVPILMPAHLALVLVVVYMFCWQWIVAAYIKLFRPFNTSLLRSVVLPRYWYWCLIFSIIMYYGLTYYFDCYQKILAGFTFIYYLIKVTAYECIKVYRERMELLKQ